MREIFTKYKERLINISSRNRSLVMKKLYKKNSFDLFKLKNFDDEIDKEIIDFIMKRRNGKLSILPDPYKWEEEEKRKVKKELKLELERKLESILKKESGSSELRLRRVELEGHYNEKLNKEFEKIRTKTEEIIDYSQGLTYLLREINSTEKETGRYELYIGYPFAEGYFRDKTFIKSPLLLFPVRISKSGDEWLIENIMDQSIMLNKVFLLAFTKYNGIDLNDLETEFEDLDDLGFDDLDNLIEYLNDNNITINFNDNETTEKFQEHTKDTVIDYDLGELVLKTYLILAQFPVANSIYNDYLSLENENIENQLLKKLLINGGASRTSTSDEVLFRDLDKIKEEDFYFITDLDFSQEKAVKMVNRTSELVVYGPPGTGKSQTIANIISDGLAKGKKILMVSQKRAALDVIYNRVSNISSKVVLLHDAHKDKKSFYEKVAKEVEELSWGDESASIRNIKSKAKVVDLNIETLDKLGVILHKERDLGLTLQQMYSKSSKIYSKEDKRYEDFKVFRNNKEFLAFRYDAIVEALDKLANFKIIDDYRVYRKYLDSNEVILKIRQDIDCFEIDDYIDSLESLKLKYDDVVKLNFKDKQYSDKLLEEYLNHLGTNQVKLRELSRTINEEENGALLARLNDGRWWSPSYWLNYSKNKKQEELNKIEYNKLEDEIFNNLESCDREVEGFIGNVGFIKDILSPKSHEFFFKKVFENENLTSFIDELIESLRIYEEYRNLMISLSTVEALEMNLLKYSYDNTKDKGSMVNLLKLIPEFLILVNINKIEQEDREVLSKYKDYHSLRNQVNTLMHDKQNLVPRHIVTKWESKLLKAFRENQKEEKELKRQATKKRMLWPIRKYIGEFKDVLFDLFPCWLLSPETVSEILPLIEGMFDLIIFDEASQIFVENAIPTIYRGKNVVIAGDDKQLRPTSTFKVKFEDDEEYDELETAAAYEEESLLDLAKVNYSAVHLNYHYRSKYDELINFSNYAFYNGRLEVSPNIIKTDLNKDKPIERIKVDGRWIGRKNTQEALKVVDLVNEILKSRKDNETIGIITFNITQKDLIDDMLENRATRDVNFKERYYNEIERKEGNEDVSLFVKNIENVQGDERDIIIFSTGYAQNENGRILANFGSLSQDGGENRLNVAISRAKKKIHVVTSIEPEVLNVDNSKNSGPKLLKKYLQYVREVSSGNREAANTILNSLVDSGSRRSESLTFDSDFEIQVYEALRDKGYTVDTQVGVSGYRIDMAIYDQKTSSYILGIECDGAAYHSSKYARERDIHRQRFLESRGWTIMRIWSKDWWENPVGEINKIELYLKNHFGNLLEKVKDQKVLPVREKQPDAIKSSELKNRINEGIKKKSEKKIEVTSSSFSTVTIGYGDCVSLKDMKTGEVFDVRLETNPANRDLMKDIELRLLGLQLNQNVNFLGVSYKVIQIDKSSFIQ